MCACGGVLISGSSLETFRCVSYSAGIPAAIRLAGFVPGVVLLLLVAMVTNYTVLLLIKNGIISGKFSYQVGHVTPCDVIPHHVTIM